VGSFATTRLVALPTSKALPTDPPPPAILRSHVELQKQVLVGRVVEAWAFGARIQLVTDRGFSVPANVERLLYPDRDRYYTDLESGQRRKLTLNHNPPVPILLEGDGSQGLIATKIPDNYNIEPGDEIVTQDDRYFLPARVRIARVTEVLKQPRQPGYVTLKAEPLADLPAMRDVFVVYPEYRRAQPAP
jgi:cell shape-determining protein MreC